MCHLLLQMAPFSRKEAIEALPLLFPCDRQLFPILSSLCPPIMQIISTCFWCPFNANTTARDGEPRKGEQIDIDYATGELRHEAWAHFAEQQKKSDRLQLPARAITQWRSHVGKWLLETRARLNKAKGDKVDNWGDRFWPSNRDNLLGRLNCLRAARCQFWRRAVRKIGEESVRKRGNCIFVTNRWLLQQQGSLING